MGIFDVDDIHQGDTLPKSNKSSDWLAYADQKLKQFQDYHSQTNMIGQLSHPYPLTDDYSKTLSDNEVSASAKGMQLLRNEQAAAAQKAPAYHRGGMIRKTGDARLEKGELVIPSDVIQRIAKRKPQRVASRKTSRSKR